MAVLSSLLTVLAWPALFHGAIAESVNVTSVPFRMMSLGASVTFGVGSTTGDSYRKDLEDLLVANGNTVSYVGTKKNGNFTDNAVEATPGFVISQIADLANTAVPMLKPNLVLLEAGTNNCNNGGTVPDAGTNVTNLINKIFQQSPGTTVILATILVNSVASQDACRVTINKQYTALATKLQASGAKLVLVDMRSSAGPLVSDLADGRHPNDKGYVKMANVWYSGIQQVISKDMLTKASTNVTSGAGKTTHISGNSTSSADPTQTSTVATTSPSLSESARTRALGSLAFAGALGLLLGALMI